MATVNDIKDILPKEDTKKVSKQDCDYSQRSQWLQTAALGTDDGLVSAASLMMGVGFLRITAERIKKNL